MIWIGFLKSEIHETSLNSEKILQIPDHQTIPEFIKQPHSVSICNSSYTNFKQSIPTCFERSSSAPAFVSVILLTNSKRCVRALALVHIILTTNFKRSISA